MPETVTAVFNCQSSDDGSVHLEATDDAETYPSFVESTAGQIDMNIWNDPAAEYFEAAGIYRVTFERIDEG